MLGYYNWSVVLTYINMGLGMWGIFLSVEGNYPIALVCMMCVGIIDMFDGKIARLIKRNDEEKRFGIQIDSLCDLICFGVFPAVFVYTYGAKAPVYVIILILYVLAAMIRLGYFNVAEEMRQQNNEEVRASYKGLPVTAAAIFMPLLFVCEDLIGGIKLIYLVVLLIALGILFLLKFNVKKMSKKVFAICLVLATLLVLKLFL